MCVFAIYLSRTLNGLSYPSLSTANIDAHVILEHSKIPSISRLLATMNKDIMSRRVIQRYNLYLLTSNLMSYYEGFQGDIHCDKRPCIFSFECDNP